MAKIYRRAFGSSVAMLVLAGAVMAVQAAPPANSYSPPADSYSPWVYSGPAWMQTIFKITTGKPVLVQVLFLAPTADCTATSTAAQRI